MAYIDFWRRWRDFSGKTSRGDFWAAILTHVLISFFLMITVSMVLVIAFDMPPEDAIRYFQIFWTVYELIWIVPFGAIIVRRLRDAGFIK